ncbi:MAG: flagella basal body P-ring formation protein FlgA [Leptolyngbya sp. PLA1]|nr:flagella basal body P-ring formation protein FlgA [Leptolyngbya sp. PLA1]
MARVDASSPIVLADVAELAGDTATSHANMVIAPAGPRPATVSLAQVRSALEAGGANLGRLSLRGSSCSVLASLAAPPAPRQEPAPAPAVDTVRSVVAARVAELLSVGPADVRLSFEARDEALLAVPIPGRTVAVQPTGVGDRMPLAVRVYDGDQIIAQGQVRVGVLVRRRVLVATSAIAKGSAIRPGSLLEEERWLPPSSSPASQTDLDGQVLKNRLSVGQVVEMQDIEPPLVVKRGDVVAVDCLSGAFSVRTTARALSPGRLGEVIQFQSLSSKHTFRARVSGPGLAVTLATGD